MTVSSPTIGKAARKNPILLRIILVVALIAVLAMAAGPAWIKLNALNFPDNDDGFRYWQVRDLMAGQSWWDLRQHRLNPPMGGDMHWSRLADLPMLIISWPLSLVSGVAKATTIAALIVPPILHAATILVLTRAGYKIGKWPVAIPVAAATVCSAAMMASFVPGRIDHHGLQLLLSALVVSSIFSTNFKSGILGGLAMAASLLIGLECAPVLVSLAAGQCIYWALTPHQNHDSRMGFMTGLGAGPIILGLVSVGPGALFSLNNDAFGLIHFTAIVSAGLLMAVAMKFGARPKILGRIIILGLVGFITGLAISTAIYLASLSTDILGFIIHGPYDRVDPLLRRLWLSHVSETMPIGKKPAYFMLSYGVFFALAPLAAIWLALWLKRRKELSFLGPLAIVTTALLVAACLGWFWQLRIMGQASLLATIPVGWLIGEAYRRDHLGITLAIFAIFMPLIPWGVGVYWNEHTKKPVPTLRKQLSGCMGAPAFRAIEDAPPALVLAPIDTGAQIIVGTHHLSFSAPYHRNNRGNLLAYHFFISTPDNAHAQVLDWQRQGLNPHYVAFCKGSVEATLLAQENKDGLMAALRAGHPPAWLKIVGNTGQEGHNMAVYEMITPPQAALRNITTSAN